MSNAQSWLKWFFESNDNSARLVRTIVQGVLGVAASALAYYAASAPEWVTVIVAPLIMAVLSPIMAEIGKHLEPADDTPKLGD